jgi:hypothetical protein
MGGFDRAGLDAEFFPDGDWRSILVVNIGHPACPAWNTRKPPGTPDPPCRPVPGRGTGGNGIVSKP